MRGLGKTMPSNSPDNQRNARLLKGFTLLEVLIVVSIIGILAAVALPAFQDYSKTAKFTEVMLAAAPYRLAVEQVLVTGNCPSPLDHGNCGIPDEVSVPTGYVASLTVQAGIVRVQATEELDNNTFILTPDSATPPIQWSISGTCVANNFC